MADSKERTHTAFTMQRIGKKLGRWLEIGSGRIDEQGADLFLDRLPVGGFTGYVRLMPNGERPPALPVVPQRPGGAADSDSDDDEY